MIRPAPGELPRIVFWASTKPAHTGDVPRMFIEIADYAGATTDRRLQLADILRSAAADIVAGADPGPRLADLRATIAAWESGA